MQLAVSRGSKKGKKSARSCHQSILHMHGHPPAVSSTTCHVGMYYGSMASACATAGLEAVAASPASTPPACPSKNTTLGCRRRRRRRTVSCRATTGGRRGEDGLLWLPRRDVLLTGLGLSLTGYQGLASAAALETTPLESCRRGDRVNDRLVECTDPNRGFPCPPAPSVPAVVDFEGRRAVKRVRRPVHRLSLEDQEKYKEAVAKMRALPACNPLSFAAQAAIHQSYCDGHYRYDPKKKNAPFDVHFSWIFAPWHRMYIYFYEKALGQLIGDDTFALPYWNWDVPAGMVVPALFKGDHPLYDRDRNQEHLDTLVHLDRNDQSALIPFNSSTPQDDKYKAEVFRNLCIVHQQQIRLGRDARSFLGEKLCTEMKRDTNNSQGTLESMAHTAIHIWVGRSGPPPGAPCCSADNDGFLDHDGTYSCRNDMGFLGTAGRDPIFYSHHANVDRLWHLWSTKLGGKGFNDPEWLDASFDFYDDYEDPHLVRVKFRDVLETSNLGYTYDAESDKDLPWLGCELTPLVPRGARRPSAPEKKPAFPVTLRKNQVVEVPAVAVPPASKQRRLLVIQGIEYDPMAENKFDVAINVPKGLALQVGPQYTEYAGTFAVVPSSKEGGRQLQGKIALCIDGVLDDIGAAGDSTVNVVIVPRTEAEIKLKLAPTIQNQN